MNIIQRSFLSLLLSLLLGTPAVSAQDKELNNLLEAASKAARKGQYAQVDSLYALYVEQCRQKKQTQFFNYAEALKYLSRREAVRGNIGKAIEMQEEVVAVHKTAPDCTMATEASAISDLSLLYSQRGDYQKALDTAGQSLELFTKKFGADHHFCGVVLGNIASFYSLRGATGDYQKAVEYGNKAVELVKSGTPEYANALNSLVVYYSQAGDMASADRIQKRAMKEARKRLKEDGASYATILNNHAIRMANMGYYTQALEFAKEAKAQFEESGHQTTLPYAKLLVNTATIYSHLHQYAEARQLLETALPVLESTVGRQNTDYIRATSDLSAVYKAAGNLEKADEMANVSDKIGRELGGQDNLKYAKSLSKQATVFASNGNYRRAIEHEKQALRIYERRNDQGNAAVSLCDLASYFFHDGDHAAAIALADSALHIFEKSGKPSLSHAQVLNNVSILYYNLDDFAKAADYGKRSLAMYEQLNETESAIYAKVLANVGLFSFRNQQLGPAIEYTERAFDIHKRILGEEHPDNVFLMYNLANYYSEQKQPQKAQDFYNRALTLQSLMVRTNFLHLTSAERERFWSMKNYVFKLAPTLAFIDRDNEDLLANAYNSTLFTKGILLNSDIDFKNLLLQSNDKTLLGKYNRLTDLYERENALLKLPAARRGKEFEDVVNQIYELERELVKGSKEYGSFTSNLNIGLADVSRSLGSDDVAVEFIDDYIEGIGRTYMALYLRKGWQKPRMEVLFSDHDLEELDYDGKTFQQAFATPKGINRIYNDTLLGKKIWQPLVRHFDGVKNIYFSPSGLLYQFGIEYLFCNDSLRVGDVYNLYRLSSTKSLAQAHDAPQMKTATIFGGLNYDMTVAQLQTQHDRLQADAGYMALAGLTPIEDDTRALDSISTRGSVSYLPGTLEEAQTIGLQLRQHSVDTQMKLMEEGTEEAFKALNGQRRSIIHIATHGFFFSEEQVRRSAGALVFLQTDADGTRDHSMNYSGLLLSGSNYTLRGKKLPQHLEDGILTAKEISQIDLRGAELIVLSACQTGLGEIKDDGVFGLQRGFKKAGAQTLLMSLWSVSDAATNIMMSSFYTHLMEGMTKHQAFLKAQQAVRDGGFQDPYYWASFIILDGFN